ncbi:3-carboxy-cis,cis-muconate cycloisomerase [Streptomyces venezuelae]|uniref:3-carboxy-cis,cis-muconate cycloisomerase n=1 Tax=Streptomyces venezuelae TaxID=54571 RepID=A0A5P2BNW3_STRVZ|nr:lyase family protein [Streptomyces venezuelae]QES32033.1 3-carboxy-cis,cis-muconate cycloisomerase [Streptomyces venezuelae]
MRTQRSGGPEAAAPPAQPDAGLLSPVRAGTAVEAAVGDEAWLQAMLDAEAALARAQARTGTVPAAAAEAITAAARAEHFDVRALALAARSTANPVVGLVAALTRQVARRAPEAAEYVHRGSTSQDVFDTGAMLVAARALRLIVADLRETAASLAELAGAHRDTVMAGRTLALHAVPTTFGLKAAGWRHLVLESVARLERVAEESLVISLGGAAGTLAGYLQYAQQAPQRADRAPEDAGRVPEGEGRVPEHTGQTPERADQSPKHADQVPKEAGRAPEHTGQTAEHADQTPKHADRAPGDDGARSDGDVLDALVGAFAVETGLGRPVLPWHALRTPVADLGAALAHTAGALGKMAADVQVLARTEIGEVAEPAPDGRGASSAMPHKANPVLATLIRSAAVQVPALGAVLAQCLPTEDERSAGLWHAEWQPLRECLRLTGGAARAAAELAAGLVVHPQRMRANLDMTAGQVVSERLAAHLAPLLGRSVAKQLLSRASQQVRETGRPLGRVLAELPALAGVVSQEELARLLDPRHYTGAAGPLVDRALRG